MQLIVYAVGLDNVSEKALKGLIGKNIPAELRDYIKVFQMPGKMNINDVNPLFRLMLKMVAYFVRKKKELTPDEKAMANIVNAPIDNISKDALNGLIEYIKDNSNE